MITVEGVDDWARANALESDWRALSEAAAEPCVFLGYDWAHSWWDVYGDEATPLILVARAEGGDVVGIAPFTISSDSGGGRFRRLMCIGQDPTYGEYLDVLARPGHETEVAKAFAERLCGPDRRAWDVVMLHRVRDDSSTMATFTEALAGAGVVGSVSPTAPSPFLKLGSEFEDVLADRSSNFRRQFRHASNRLEKAGEVEVVVAEAGPDATLSFDEAFDELLRLHTDRWNTSGTFDEAAFIDFHHRFGQALLERDQLYLALLRLDGVAIAARYDFVFGDKIWCVQGGWDQDYKQFRPGTLMTGEVIKWGIERGVREYDFLAGEHEYKRRWAGDERGLHAFVAANPRTLRGKLYRKLRT